MNWSGAAYLENQGGLQELAAQQREEALRKKRDNSLGYQIGQGVKGTLKGAAGGAIKGALLGAVMGGGIGALPGAALGAASGGLSGSGVMSGAEQKSLATNAAMMAMSKGMGRYGGGAGTNNGAKYTDSMGLGGMSDADYEEYMNRIARGG